MPEVVRVNITQQPYNETRKEEGQPLNVTLRMTFPKSGSSNTGDVKAGDRKAVGSRVLGILYGVAFVSLGSWKLYSLVS